MVKFGKRGRESNVNQNHCRKQTSQDKKRLNKQKSKKKERSNKKHWEIREKKRHQTPVSNPETNPVHGSRKLSYSR